MINTVSDVYMDSKRYKAANCLWHFDQLIYNLLLYINIYNIYVYELRSEKNNHDEMINWMISTCKCVRISIYFGESLSAQSH